MNSVENEFFKLGIETAKFQLKLLPNSAGKLFIEQNHQNHQIKISFQIEPLEQNG